MAQHPGWSHLVVVGSSAGGIDALSTLVAVLPADFPAALVIAQHLDPHHESHLADILARHSVLPVRIATHQAPLEPGVVYVVPANQHVEIEQGTLVLSPEGSERSKPSIDRLFTSAAAAYGERLIAVILSGTGSDGASGARAVKEAGGTVLSENPATAQFPGMPLALGPTTVDMVADLEQLGSLLRDLVIRQRAPVGEGEHQELSDFLAQLRERYGLDFTQYKLPTIQRRLQRRLVATHTQTLADYTAYLMAHPEEVRQLTNSFLINVTEFFRDPELFTLLEHTVLPALIARAQRQGNPLRLWSAGCSTGEEAYSLALLVAETLGDDLERMDVRIFATDIDADAVAFARRALYPASAVVHLPVGLLSRYFTAEDGHYQLDKRVRVLTVFGQHDLGQSAPFREIDLVVCRNVLIYFTPELQQRALELFAYALHDEGYLVLGKAESVGPLASYFALVNPAQKLFRRQGERLALPPARLRTLQTPLPRSGHTRPSPLPSLGPRHRPPLKRTPRSVAEEVLQMTPVGIVVVDRHYDIQFLNRSARILLSIHSVALDEDLIHLAQTLPSPRLRALIDRAFRTPSVPARAELTAADPLTSEQRSLALSVTPHQWDAQREHPDMVQVLIQDVTELAQTHQTLEQELQQSRADLARARELAEASLVQVRQEAAEALGQRDTLVEGLREKMRSLSENNYDLTSTVETLQTINQQFQVRTEEAQAVTEEAETLNEELQATNEELETLNEELQATNEELQTTNEELESRSQEVQVLSTAREAERVRVSALVHSLEDAVAIIGNDRAIVLSNPAYLALVQGGTAALVAIDSATGQPFAEDAGPLERAARGEAFSLTCTLPGPEGIPRRFEARGQPIRDAAGQTQGGVLMLHALATSSP
jgi:two-component system CheB/CheR fusion protein